MSSVTSYNSSSSSLPPPSSPVVEDEDEDELMEDSQDQDNRQQDGGQADIPQGQDGGEGVAGGDNEAPSVEAENYYLYPDYNPADHVQESTSTGSCLQYRFYDRSNEDHRRRQPRDMHEYQEKCKTLDKKTDFLAKQLGRALKENVDLKERLAAAVKLIERSKVKCEDSGNRLKPNDNGKNPLDIFPEEVWQLIFGFVEDPGDLENCYKSCVTFRNMLKEKKACFLFPKIFKLVNSKFPISTSSILNFRLASKACKKLADSSLETRPNRYNFHYLNEHEYNQSEEFRYTFNIDDDPTILRAYKKGATHLEKLVGKVNSNNFYKNLKPDWSPFPSRHLIISDKDIPNLPPEIPQNFPMGNYRHGTFSLLNKIGPQIKFLDIWIHLSFTPESWYNMLYNWLFYVPNVRVLQFKYPFPLPIEDKITADKFNECVNSHPFPNLNKLVMITLENCPMILINSVIQANPQIEQLQILRYNMEKPIWKWEQLEFSNGLLNRLFNLKKISVTINDDKEFQQFENCNWPHVEIIKTSVTINTKGSWERVICWLNRFSESLQTLIIRLPYEWNPFFVWRNAGEDKRRILLELPKLKKLRIAMRFHTSIDFILGLSCLEDLYVFVDHMDYEEALISDQLKVANGQIIQFNEFYECMELSNIWDVMPSLKNVYVAVRDKNHGFLICRRYKYRKVNSGVVAKVNC